MLSVWEPKGEEDCGTDQDIKIKIWVGVNGRESAAILPKDWEGGVA